MNLSDAAEVFVYEGGNQTVPANVVRARIDPKCRRIEKEAFVGRAFLREVEFSEGLVEICEGAFRGCEWLQYIITPSTLKRIGARAFYECMNMRYAKLNERLVTISHKAFSECYALKYMHLPSTVSQLYSRVFANCCELRKVSLGQALKKVFKGTFEGCNKLELIVKPEKTVLVAGAVPESTTIDSANYKEASKAVFDKVEEVIAGRKNKEANKDQKGMVDLKPAAETLEDDGNELKEKEEELGDVEGRLKKITEERDALQESEAKMKALQSDMEAEQQEAMEKIESLQNANVKLESDMETKEQKLMEEKESLKEAKEANARLGQENERILKASKDMEAKLQATADSLEKERIEKAEIKGDCNALRKQIAGIQKEKGDMQTSLLRKVEKYGQKYGALQEQIKRLRKGHRREHDSVVSVDDEVQNDLEGMSIGLESAQGRTARSKLSSVTGEENFESCVEELESKRARKRKRSSEEASRKSPEGTINKMKSLTRGCRHVKQKKLMLRGGRFREPKP